MRKVLIILLGFFIIGRTLAFDANTIFAKANEAYAQEMYAEAIELYQQVIALDTNRQSFILTWVMRISNRMKYRRLFYITKRQKAKTHR